MSDSALFRSRLLASGLAGALLAPLALVTVTYALRALSGAAPLPFARLLGAFLTPLGWMAAPLFGAALGALAAWPVAESARRRGLVVGLSVTLVALGIMLLNAPSDLVLAGQSPPSTRRSIARSILKWSYRSPSTVAQILPYSRHRDPVVREQAVLALGVNLIVTDIERASERWPPKYATHPLRDSLRVRLLAALADSSENVRAEAARALWKATRTFGPQPAAAETLALVLDRAGRPAAVERLAWLALDAAGGASHPALDHAVERFAAATPDSELARAARLVMER